MTRTRSQRKDISRLCDQLRESGWAYGQIASHLAETRSLGILRAFRLAHGLTQEGVASRFNQIEPEAAPITGQQICYWEAWPGPTGRQASLRALDKLARVFACDIRQLIGGSGDYTHLDDSARRATNSAALHREAPENGDEIASRDATPRWRISALADVDSLLERASEGSMAAADRDLMFDQLAQALTAWGAFNLKRRELLQVLGWAATSAASSPYLRAAHESEVDRLSQVISASGRVDQAVLDNVDEVLWRCMRQDDALGPHVALETTLAQRRVVSILAHNCPDSLRPRLLSTWSNLSRFAGWLSFDLGAFRDAEHYYQDAREKAHEAKDTPLGVMVLCNLSHLATWTGRPRVGIDHAVAAQGWARRIDDGLLRAYSSDVAARAYASAGEESLCLMELETAEGEIGDPSEMVSSGASLAYFYGAGQLAASKSVCQLRLRDPVAAAFHARESLSMTDESFARNRAMATLYLAQALAAQGEGDAAGARLTAAADLLQQNRSARVINEFRAVRRQLIDKFQIPVSVNLRDHSAPVGLD